MNLTTLATVALNDSTMWLTTSLAGVPLNGSLIDHGSLDSLDASDVSSGGGGGGGHVSEVHSQCQITARFVINFIIACPLCVIGIVGSVLSYVALGMDTEIAAVASFTLRSLACSDAVLLANWLLHYTLPAVFQYYGIRENVSVVWVCLRLYTYPVLFISQMTTVWLTVLIAVCRYVSVGRPLSSVGRLCSLGVARVTVAAIVVGSVVFNIPRYLSATLESFSDSNNVTLYLLRPTELATRKSYLTLYTNHIYSVVNFFLPFLLLTVFSCLLIRAYRIQQRRHAALTSRKTPGENSTTRVIVAVVVVFAACNLPAKVVQTFVPWASKVDCPSASFIFARLTFVLELFNSTANFVVYCVLRRQFREALRRALSARRRDIKRLAASAGGGGDGEGSCAGTTTGGHHRRRPADRADCELLMAERSVTATPSAAAAE